MKKLISVKKNKEFRVIYKEGNSFANKLLVLYYLPNYMGYNRLGLSVSKKVGGSVVRNRVKRLIRQAYVLNAHNIKTDYDFIIIARQGMSRALFKQVQSAVIHIYKISGLLIK